VIVLEIVYEYDHVEARADMTSGADPGFVKGEGVDHV